MQLNSKGEDTVSHKAFNSEGYHSTGEPSPPVASQGERILHLQEKLTDLEQHLSLQEAETARLSHHLSNTNCRLNEAKDRMFNLEQLVEQRQVPIDEAFTKVKILNKAAARVTSEVTKMVNHGDQ